MLDICSTNQSFYEHCFQVITVYCLMVQLFIAQVAALYDFKYF